MRLFEKARERVPSLAEGIGGIQRPMVFSPYGADGFDIGQLTEADKAHIPLAQPKPLYVMSVFQDEVMMDDRLKIGTMIDEKLREITARGKNAGLIYVDVKEFPDAYKLRGRYSVNENNIALKTNLFKGSQLIDSFEINGTTDNLDELVEKIMKRIKVR